MTKPLPRQDEGREAPPSYHDCPAQAAMGRIHRDACRDRQGVYKACRKCKWRRRDEIVGAT